MESSCTRFTAAEGGARLAASAGTKNILVTEHTTFISTSVLIEHAYRMKGLLSSGQQRSIYITRSSRIECVAHELTILTDLAITKAKLFTDVENWKEELEYKEVLVCTSEVFKMILEGDVLNIRSVNILVIDSCHLIFKDEHLQYIMKIYKQCEENTRPRILALTYPLFTANKAETDMQTEASTPDENIEDESQNKVISESKVIKSDFGVYTNVDDFDMYEKLQWKIEELEEALCCEMDLAEDIDGGKRLSATTSKPKEQVIEYSPLVSTENLPKSYIELEKYMKTIVFDALEFINEHRYDPTEIYGEDLYEEFMNIPDPTIDPKNIFMEFLYVLDELGPFAADKAAVSLLVKLEKLKIKVPYERHFLLLCLCTSVFVKIRCYADIVFSRYSSDWDKIVKFSKPKVLRLAEVLEQFQPPDNQSNKRIDNNTTIMESDINAADSTTDIKKNDVNTADSITNIVKDDVSTKNENAAEITNIVENESGGDNTVNVKKNDLNIDSNTSIVKCDVNAADSIAILESDIDSAESNKDNTNAVDIDTNIVINEEIEVIEKKSDETSSDTSDSETLDTEKTDKEMKRSKKTELLSEIDNCDFETLGNKIEDRVNTYEANLKELDDIEPEKIKTDGVVNNRVDIRMGYMKRGHRTRGRRSQRSNAAKIQQFQQNPDALCGIIFLKEPLMAKIMFLVIVDMSRSRSSLGYLCAQYCATEGGRDKDSQREGKRQEEVLKKFRMHECNLLLATSALEEGIDLPRCNLVVRWDVPPSYRSHGLCRGRARAPRSSVALLADSINSSEMLVHNLAVYKELDQIITRKCGCGVQNEPPQEEENEADSLAFLIKPYVPLEINSKPNPTDIHENKSLDAKIDETIKINNAEQNGEKAEDKLDLDDVIDRDIKKENGAIGIEKKHKILDFREQVNGFNMKYKFGDKKSDDNTPSVDLNSAIALINRYCGKLPSDTFTRLAPQWWLEKVQMQDRRGEMRTAFICTLRMPLNCPVKYNIVGHPMPTRVLARRMVALQACRILHKSGELDDQLMPIGKENFKAVELENNIHMNENETNEYARPGTTKRRQYYYKRTAWTFTNCQAKIDCTDEEIDAKPVLDGKPDPSKRSPNILHSIISTLWCALPERYNTRGRRLHAPQHAAQAVGVLMARRDPPRLQIPAFPVYTRSGEVRVSVDPALDADVRLSPKRVKLIKRFMRFVFSDVLRVRRGGMKLQMEGCSHNNYYVVPTVKKTRRDGSTWIDVDWSFLELIYKHTEEKKLLEIEKPIIWDEEKKEKKGKDKTKCLENPLLKSGEVFVFDAEKYREAVVTPWYRNQDQPQFFLVAEICWKLTPDSAFPSAQHKSFRSYYRAKYGATLTQSNQPLLDVDHTSARLNLLTPRYVNRKGVALPVSSERTRRAKRDRLDQKQILVPELCRVHPFAAPLWFATVALPCVLYRINALLIADEIRRSVAIDVGLGIASIDDESCPGFQWPPLDFGWSLAEVLNADYEKGEKKKDEDDPTEDEIDKEVKILDDKEEPEDKEVKEKTINDILQEKMDAENCFEIGTWSNDMASSIPLEYDEFMEPLPPNLTFCTSSSGGANWSEPKEKPKIQFNTNRAFSVADSDCSYLSSDFDTDDSDITDGSDDDSDNTGFCSSKNSNAAMGVRIEYKTSHEAEAVDLFKLKPVAPAPQPDVADDAQDMREWRNELIGGDAPQEYIENFRKAVEQHEVEITKNNFILKNNKIVDLLPEAAKSTVDNDKNLNKEHNFTIDNKIEEIFPFGNAIEYENGQITLESIEKNKRLLLAEIKQSLPDEEIKKMNCFSMKDIDIDSKDYVNEKIVNVGFDSKDKYDEKVNNCYKNEYNPYYLDKGQNGKDFDFDFQPDLEGHPGPSPSVILQALTMSNANDGINLERLETIGDSFLKFAITAYLYCAHPAVHEGKLSHMRSKQVSNLNLYRLGRNKRLGARMIASKFEPHDNWLPPCHIPPPTLQPTVPTETKEKSQKKEGPIDSSGCFIPYNLITQHSIPDKSIADCVEALIGAYLLECGPRGALLFMSWLGIRVLPVHLMPLKPDHPSRKEMEKCTAKPKSPQPSDSSCSDDEETSHSPPEPDWSWPGRAVGALRPYQDDSGQWIQPILGELKAPPSPLLRYIDNPEGELEQMLSGYDALERTLQYRFRDRSLLLQALTHASHQKNRLTDCYQRLEFLGDAILDYLITRHLYEDPRRHSPGALTDLRSALVNNTIFATLAARHGFHKFFRHMSPGLNEVLAKYVKIQEENGHSISEEHYLIQEDELEQAEDVEVPKALGDLFESVTGAIFLDSGMSLAAVWASAGALLSAELDAFSAAAPKSPVRELLEAEPDTAKFGKPERLADGRRVRVCVEVFGRGAFKGIGRNYRIAKGTAARCALRHLRNHKPE